MKVSTPLRYLFTTYILNRMLRAAVRDYNNVLAFIKRLLTDFRRVDCVLLSLHWFGYPDVTLDGERVEGFISNKVIVLCAYLTAEKRTHAREKLSALFWSDLPEDRSKANLRQALHNLQKLIPDYFDVTRQTVQFSEEHAYVIDTDALLHTTLQVSEETVADVVSIIDSYRGDFLEGIVISGAPEIENWLYAQRDHFRSQVIHLMEDVARHFAAVADWRESVIYYQRLLAIEPWRESSHRELMRLFVRQNKYQAALKQYKTCVAALDNELEIEPCDTTKALYERIRLGAPTMQTLAQEIDPFVGREQEIAQIQGLILSRSVRLITLKGIGGNGKSRLALHLGQLNQHEFVNGVYFVPLASIDDPDAVVTQVATAVGLTPVNGKSLVEQILDFFEQREVLLILDNFEHLLEAAPVIADLLTAAPHVLVMVTSRESLQLREEYIIPVNGFSHAGVPTSLQEASQLESVQFLSTCMQKRGMSFDEVQEGQLDDIVALCQLLQGSPLGIELAAALLASMSATQVVAKMQSDLDILRSQFRNQPDRHMSLRAVFNHSWQTLQPDTQQIFAKLAIFRGSFSLDAAREITGADEDALETLIAKSLVKPVCHDDETRYIIHELLWQYALEILQAVHTDYQQIRANHISYYRSHIQNIAEDTPYNQVLDCVDREFSNLHVGWQYAVDAYDMDALRQMGMLFHRYYEYRSLWHEGAQLLNMPLQKLPEPIQTCDGETWGILHARVARLWLRLGRVADSHQYAKTSLNWLRHNDADIEMLAFAENVLGITEMYQGNLDSAIGTFRICIDHYATLDLKRHMLKPLVNLGGASFRAGYYKEAIEVMKKGLELAEAFDDQHAQSHFLNNLGATYQTIEDYDAALTIYERSVAISLAIDNVIVQGTSLLNVSEIYLLREQFKDAVEYGHRAIEVLGQTKERLNYALALSILAQSYIGMQDLDGGRQYLIESIRIACETDSLPTLMHTFWALGHYYLVVCETDKALQLFCIVANHPATQQDVRTRAEAILRDIPDNTVACDWSDAAISRIIRLHRE